MYFEEEDCRVKPGNDGKSLSSLYRVESANCQHGYHWPRRVVGGWVVWLGFSA
jgi:hypothetical protein